ncbi:hypothetical protein GGR57DRAFT_73871 [Xylariaceae sp. FL1272]|nr:hypothetical protein GGR57DRAFT_73871 [Xylariaceae sp. FL1272]
MSSKPRMTKNHEGEAPRPKHSSTARLCVVLRSQHNNAPMAIAKPTSSDTTAKSSARRRTGLRKPWEEGSETPCLAKPANAQDPSSADAGSIRSGGRIGKFGLACQRTIRRIFRKSQHSTNSHSSTGIVTSSSTCHGSMAEFSQYESAASDCTQPRPRERGRIAREPAQTTLAATGKRKGTRTNGKDDCIKEKKAIQINQTRSAPSSYDASINAARLAKDRWIVDTGCLTKSPKKPTGRRKKGVTACDILSVDVGEEESWEVTVKRAS